MENEYNVDITMQTLPYSYIRWIDNEEIDLKKLNLTSDTRKVQDMKGRYLLLFANQWEHQLGAGAQRGIAALGVQPELTIAAGASPAVLPIGGEHGIYTSGRGAGWLVRGQEIPRLGRRRQGVLFAAFPAGEVGESPKCLCPAREAFQLGLP